jgi:hypothetical protein
MQDLIQQTVAQDIVRLSHTLASVELMNAPDVAATQLCFLPDGANHHIWIFRSQCNGNTVLKCVKFLSINKFLYFFLYLGVCSLIGCKRLAMSALFTLHESASASASADSCIHLALFLSKSSPNFNIFAHL